MLSWFARLFAPRTDTPETRPPLPSVPAPALKVGLRPGPIDRRGRFRPARQTKRFICAVVGESFRNDDGTSRQDIIRRCAVGEPVLLVPEPLNRYDRNAIAVRRAATGEQLGYLRREVAARLVDDLADDYTASAFIYRIGNADPQIPLGVFLSVALTCRRDGISRARAG